MRKIKSLLILTACALLLTACLGSEDSGNPIIDDSPTWSPSDSSDNEHRINDMIEIVVEDDTLPPEEGMVRSRLTNEWVKANVAAMRPIAVMIPNETAALPQYALSEASILYEANVEGRMTRLMAIYEDWTRLNKVGNVRSLRTYYGYWAFEWDAFLAHYGGPLYANDLLALPDTQNIDGTTSLDGGAFFQTTDRREPHNTYLSGDDALKVIQKKGYRLEYRGLADTNHFQFATKAKPNSLTQYGEDAQSATYIDMSGCYPLTRCYFEYNEDDGLYYRSQYLSGSTDGPHTDATGTQLTFKNILIQNTYYEELEDGYLVFQCHDETRDGWYFTNGKGIHVTWKKTSDYGATRYYDDNGEEIVLNTGKTMICIVEDGDSFTFR